LEKVNKHETGLDCFCSITLEFQELKDRVRHFVCDRNWLSDGECKECVIRALPQNIGAVKVLQSQRMAHINRDLPAAILEIYQANGENPNRCDPHHADYETVNEILKTVET